MAEQHKSHLSQVMSPKVIEARRIELDRNTQERIMGENYQNPIAEDKGELGQVGVEMSYIQSQMHSDYDSAESSADSDLEDGDLRKMLASPLFIQGREDHESSRRPTASGNQNQ